MFTIKKNDTSPAIQVVLKYSDCTPVNITDASVRFHMRLYGSTSPKVDAAAVVVSIGGTVEYPWLPADTDESGSYEGEFEVTYADGTVETFPSSGFIRIEIVDAIA